MTVGCCAFNAKQGGEGKTIGIQESIEHLLSRRAALLPSRPTDYDWVADDPVVGFVGPALWHFTRSQEQAPGQHDVAHNYWSNAAHFTLLRDHLDKIVAELHAADIPVVLLKGIVLADTLFASPGLREMGDIDLLVRQENFVQGAHILEQLGLTPRPGPFVSLFCDLPEAEARGRDRGAKIVPGAGVDGQQRWRPGEWVFYGEDGAMLDLHWHLVPAVWMRRVYRVDIETV